ncbi:MAG: DUF4199 domain-containing protein [Bacteroidota bacterium]
MENQQTMPYALKWGGILGGVLVIFYWWAYAGTLFSSPGINYLTWLLVAGGAFMGIKAYKDGNNQYLTFGQGLTVGTLVSLFAGLIEGVFKYLYYEVIDPGVKQRVLDMVMVEMEKNPEMTEEMMDAALPMIEMTNTGWVALATGLLGTLILGVIFSLVIAGILRSD